MRLLSFPNTKVRIGMPQQESSVLNGNQSNGGNKPKNHLKRK